MKLNPASGNGFPDRLCVFCGVPLKKKYEEKANAADVLIATYKPDTHLISELVKQIYQVHQGENYTYYLDDDALNSYIEDHDANVDQFNDHYKISTGQLQ